MFVLFLHPQNLRFWRLHPSPLSFGSAYPRSPQPPPWHSGPWFASNAPRVSAPAGDTDETGNPGLKTHEEGWKWLRMLRLMKRYPESKSSCWKKTKINHWQRAVGWRSSPFVDGWKRYSLQTLMLTLNWDMQTLYRWVTIPAGFFVPLFMFTAMDQTFSRSMFISGIKPGDFMGGVEAHQLADALW